MTLIDTYADVAADPGSTEVVVQITGLVFGSEPLPDAI
jgi:hypothetical protein